METALGSGADFALNSLASLLTNYWTIAILVAVGFYKISKFAEEHLSEDKRASLVSWLSGKYEYTWSFHFCNKFDALFGKDPISLKRIIRSAIASLISVFLLYFIFSNTLGILGQNNRMPQDMLLWQVLLLGAAINILPDYLSLWETRWVLERFKRVKSFMGQIVILTADLIFSGLIIWAGIQLYLLLFAPEIELEIIELVALFSIYAIFFYSTFITSAWAWLFMFSTWFMRLFYRTPLREWLNIKKAPGRGLGVVGASFIIVVASALSPLVQKTQTKDQTAISAFDVQLCQWFPGNVCARLGRLTTDQKEVLDFFTKSSLGGGTKHCIEAAGLKFNVGDYNAALPLFAAACEGDIADACAAQAYILNHTSATEKDLALAAELYGKACLNKIYGACVNLGRMFYDGVGVEKNPEKAMMFFGYACNTDTSVGCHNLGVMYHDGEFVDQDLKLSITLFRRGCSDGSPHACTNLGNALYEGTGIDQDEAQATNLYKSACSQGFVMACANLGNAYFNGRGVEQNFSRALELLRPTCTADEAAGCKSLFLLFASGHGLPETTDDSMAIDRIKCESADTISCNSLGVIHEFGDKIHRDLEKALSFYQRSCELENPVGCLYLQEFKERRLN